MTSNPLGDRVKRANVELHARMAATYNRDQPHYRIENVERVTGIVEELSMESNGGMVLDLGCGTGFMLDIAAAHFDRVVGIDLTKQMLDQVEDRDNVSVLIGDSEALHFQSASFDVCTAYSFLHHLPSLTATVSEIFRVLRPGGLFYSDQDPNWHCFQAISELDRGTSTFSDLLEREIESVSGVSHECADRYAVSEETVELAEFQKLSEGGLRPADLLEVFRNVGFRSVDARFEWYLGKGNVLHGQSEEAAQEIDDYLRSVLPLSEHFFKYLSVIARK